MVDLCAENENWTKSKLHWSMISVGTCTKEKESDAWSSCNREMLTKKVK